MISNEFLCGFIVFETGQLAPITHKGPYNVSVTPAGPGAYLLQLGSALNPPSGDDLDADVSTSRTPGNQPTGWNLAPTANPGEYRLDLWESIAGLVTVAQSGGIVVRVAIKRVEPRTTI